MHAAKYHKPIYVSFASSIQPHLIDIITCAASYDSARYPRHHKRLNQLLDIWEEAKYFHADFILKLHKVVSSTTVSIESDPNLPDAGRGTSYNKNAAYTMPSTHGDISTPYYDLPAANLMSHIIPNSTIPINAQLVRPMQLNAGPAEPVLESAVKGFLKEVDLIYDEDDGMMDEGTMTDIDEMGQIISRDEVSGTMKPKEAYYGWSVKFCEEMKRLERDGPPEMQQGNKRDRSLSRSRSYSRGSSGSRHSSPPRRRRRSSSGSNGRSVSRGRMAFSQNTDGPTERPRSFGRPETRPTMPFTQRPGLNQGDSRQPLMTPIDQIDNPFSSNMPPRPTQGHIAHNFPIDANGLPIPPRPPFHTGPWPPSFPVMPGGNFIPPPPPPPNFQGIWNGARENILGHSNNHNAPRPQLGPSWQSQDGNSWGQNWQARGESRRQ